MGCAASKLDMEADKTMLSGQRPIQIKKCRPRQLRRIGTFSTTAELLEAEETEFAGDNSTSGKVKSSAVAPEPIAQEETKDSDQQELMKREELEMRQESTGDKENQKAKIDELEEDKVLKGKLEEIKQRTEEMKKNMQQLKDKNEEIGQSTTTEKLKEYKDKSHAETEVNSTSEMEELAKEREETNEEQKEGIQCRKENPMEKMEKSQKRTEEQKVKEEERSREMLTAEPTESSKEVQMKNDKEFRENEEEDGSNLISKRNVEAEGEFHGSPSFRFYCRNIRSFDSDESGILSEFHRSTERREEIKQNNEPIEEVSESQSSSKESQCTSPRKHRGRRILKLKTPNAVRNLFTCYSSGNSCTNSCTSSRQYRNSHAVGKK